MKIILSILISTMLILPHLAIAASAGSYGSECMQNGGKQKCIPKTVTPWSYSLGLCDVGGACFDRKTEGELAAAIAAMAAKFTSSPTCPPVEINMYGSLQPVEWSNVPEKVATRLVSSSNWSIVVYDLRNGVCVPFGRGGSSSDARAVRSAECPREWSSVGGYCVQANASKPCSETQQLNQPNDECGNPFSVKTGYKTQTEVDYVNLVSPLLTFERYYYSGSGDSGSNVGTDRQRYDFGSSWRHNFMRKIDHYADVNRVLLQLDQGGTVAFNASNGDYVSTNFKGILKKVALSSREWELIMPDGKEWFDLHGRLIRREAINGIGVTLTYDSLGRLSSVKDGFGRTMSFQYRTSVLPENVIDSIQMPDGLVYQYAYEAAGSDGLSFKLKSLKVNNTTREYVYSSAGSTRLAGIIDENLSRYSTFGYDGWGVINYTEHAGGVERYSRQTSGQAGASSSVNTPLGGVRTFNYSTNNLVTKITETCTGCVSSITEFIYDANDRVETSIKNSVKTKFQYTSNNQHSKVSIYSAQDVLLKETSYEYHPTFNAPSKITESGRITALAYDSRGNIQQHSITDTTVSPNVTRTTTYTYVYNADVNNPYIQKLTVDGPRTGIADVMVYDYDAQGNLSTVTQQTTASTSLITRYSNYDATGQVGTITAPNGLVTQLTYTPRGWLSSRVVGFNTTTPLTTNFTYDNVGQLIQVTLPDNRTVAYTYDAAHRLTDIKDGAGNRIHYTLDLAGNRIKEEVTDSTGVLAGLLIEIQTAQAEMQLPRAVEAI